MCGIAGIVFKHNPAHVAGALLKMLDGCQHRGPDSTGLALYSPPTDDQLVLRLFLDADQCHQPELWPQRLEQVKKILAEHHYHTCTTCGEGAFARITGRYDGDIQSLSYAVEELAGVEIFSAGHTLQIIKDEGTAADIERKFDVATFEGCHGIGHVRLATESDVNPSTAHPFWAYGFTDICIVHNGQITNYFKLKRMLEQRGYRFRTENDSEVIAVYLADKMKHGIDMDQALKQSLTELDGTFSFLVATPDGIGYAKDPIGAKPMVVCETDDVVAVASEEVSLQRMFAGRRIETYEPYPGTSYSWSKSTPADLVSAR